MKRKNIALFMAILDNDFSSSILDGAAAAAKDMDCNLFVFPVDIIGAKFSEIDVNAYRYQYNVLASFLNNNSFDGIVVEYGTIVSAMNDSQKEEFLNLIGDTPVVLLAGKNDRFPSICVDNNAGLVDLMEHLISYHNFKKIGFLSGPKDNYDAIERLSTYKKTMEKYGFNYEDCIRFGNFSEYIREEIEDLYTKHPDLEAVVCANDAMAIGACNYFDGIGKVVGKDIVVTGFDDVLSSFLYRPSITTIKASPNDLSYEAVVSLVNGKCEKYKTIPSRLVIRESCGCAISEENDVKAKEIGISSDWRLNAKKKLDENTIRTQYEHELSNITREMVFSSFKEEGRYASIMKTFQRLHIKSSYLFLYDEYITHNRDDVWTTPEKINLVAHFKNDDYKTNVRGVEQIETKTLFLDERIHDHERHDYVMVPLFFGQEQIGQLLCESDAEMFKFVFILAGQFSNSLAIVDMNNKQERMKKELEEISTYKSQFLANMSHEIRTPINAIIGFNEMILRENKDESISEYATDVKNASDNLLGLVNDILDFSKIEAGKMNIIPDDYSAKEVADGVINLNRERADRKELKLELIFDENIPRLLYGDKNRIKQILINLVSNAVKYTNFGTVTMEVALDEIIDDENGKVAKINYSVKDTGIGIKQEDIENLFVKFKRIEEKRNRSIEGTGLGINIVSSLLELMGSKLNVESTYNVGSVFSFSLLQKVVDETPTGASKKAANAYDNSVSKAKYTAPSARILVVDDNYLNRKVIQKLLVETEMKIDTAEGGKACIELLKNNEYDIVFLDHMMPGMDGIETLNEIKKQSLIAGKNTKIIALTATAILGAKQTYLDAGFDNYLSKPVKPEYLNAMITEYLDESKIIRSV